MNSHAADSKKAIKEGQLEISLGVRGFEAVKQEDESSEALKAAQHAAKALRASSRKVDKPLKSLHLQRRNFGARAKDDADADVAKYAAVAEDLSNICNAIEKFKDDAEAVAVYVDELAKKGVNKEIEQEAAIKEFEESCKYRAQQCDQWRKAGDEHARNAALKVADVQGKLMRDPSEWDV